MINILDFAKELVNFSFKKSKDFDRHVAVDINFLFLALLVPTCYVLIRDYFMFAYQLINPTNLGSSVILVGNIIILILTFITLLYIFLNRYSLNGKNWVSLDFLNFNEIDIIIVLYLCLLTLTRIALPNTVGTL